VSEALFINVEVDPSAAGDPELAKKLEEVCPVDIFKAGENGVEIVEDNLDECVLCELCLNATPTGTVKVIKLYDNGAVLGAA
jgi:NAD-dependent dihydropyrimidine dehydrogenase PreA subunit